MVETAQPVTRPASLHILALCLPRAKERGGVGPNEKCRGDTVCAGSLRLRPSPTISPRVSCGGNCTQLIERPGQAGGPSLFCKEWGTDQ